MAKAAARHILVDTEELCNSLKQRIQGERALQTLRKNTQVVLHQKRADP